MGQYDGEIRLNTRISVSEAKMQLKQLQAQLARADKAVEASRRKIAENAARINQYSTDKAKIEASTDAAMLRAKDEADIVRIQELEAIKLQALKEKYDALIAKQEQYKDELRTAESIQADLTRRVQEQKGVVAGLVAQQEREEAAVRDTATAQKQALVTARETERATKRFVSSSGRMASGFLRMSVAMLGAQGAISVLRKSVNAFLSDNENVTNQIASIWSALGNALAPIITRIISLINSVMSAVASVIKALTGVDIIANYNAKALENQAAATAGAGSAAEKAEKQLAGFDEMNKLSDTSTSSSGGGGGGSGEITGLLTEVDNWFTDFAAKLGITFRDVFFNWDDLTPQDILDKVVTGLGIIVGGIAGWKLTHSVGGVVLGATIGALISLTLLTIDWASLKEKLSPKLWEIRDWLREKVDVAFEDLDELFNFDFDGDIFPGLGEKIKTALTEAAEFIDIAYWSEKVGLFYGQLAEEFINGVDELFVLMRDHGKDIVEGLFLGIIDRINSVNQWIWENIYQPFIDGFKRAFDINSPSGVMREMGHYIMSGLFNGISEKIQSVVSLFTNLKARIQETFQNIGAWFGNIFGGAWETIKSKFAEWKTYWSGLWETIKSTFSTLGTSIGSAISNAVKSGINSVISLIQNTINKAINIINRAISLINKLPGVSVGYLSTVSLPRLAKGGVVNNPGRGVTAVIGEAGREAVLPLERNTEWMDTLADKIASRIGGRDGTIVLNNYMNTRKVSEEVINYQQRWAFAMNKA